MGDERGRKEGEKRERSEGEERGRGGRWRFAPVAELMWGTQEHAIGRENQAH